MIDVLKKYWLSLFVIIIVLILCFINTSQLPKSPALNFDKLVHVIMFMGLSGVIFFDDTGYLRFPISKMRIFFGVFLFPVAFGGLIEIMQAYLTTTRSGDWFDFGGDVVGSVVGMLIALLINRYLPLRKKR